jgi:hypothetical protein
MILWPAVSAIRSIFQSLVVVGHRTGWTTLAMGVRLGITLSAAVILPRLWPTGPVGAVILVGGLASEMLISAYGAFRGVPPLKDDPPTERLPTSSDVLRFFVPLAVAQAVTPFVRSVMIGSMARTVSAELTLSGYQVATAVSGVLGAVTINMYQAVLVFVRGSTSFHTIRKYSMALGATACAIMLICSTPAIGPAVFQRIVGAPPQIAAGAMRTLAVLAFVPLLGSNTEFYGGILMLKRKTMWVTASKMTNACVCALTIVTLTRLFPAGGSVLAAIASVAGLASEAVLAYTTVRRLPECAEYWQECSRNEA